MRGKRLLSASRYHDCLGKTSGDIIENIMSSSVSGPKGLGCSKEFVSSESHGSRTSGM